MKLSNFLKLSAPEILDRYTLNSVLPFPEVLPFQIRSQPIQCENVYALQNFSPEIRNRFVLEISKALVLGGTFRILDWSEKTLIHHPFIDWAFGDMNQWNSRYDLDVPNSALIVPGTSLLLDGSWSLPFFHFMSETLGKLFVLEKIRGLQNIDNIFLTTKGLSYANFWCSVLGVEVKPLPTYPVLFDKLIIPSYSQHCGSFSSDLIDHLNLTLLNHLPSTFSRHTFDKIYIVRKGTRRILNEEALLVVLEKYGFVPLVLEDFDIFSQAQFCQNAKIIIAPHGAGLTNLIFSDNNSEKILIELFSKSYINGCYAHLSFQKDFNYFYHVSNHETENSNFYIDPKIIEDTLLDII